MVACNHALCGGAGSCVPRRVVASNHPTGSYAQQHRTSTRPAPACLVRWVPTLAASRGRPRPAALPPAPGNNCTFLLFFSFFTLLPSVVASGCARNAFRLGPALVLTAVAFRPMRPGLGVRNSASMRSTSRKSSALNFGAFQFLRVVASDRRQGNPQTPAIGKTLAEPVAKRRASTATRRAAGA